MPRTTHAVSTPSFIADPASITRSPGRQVDWDGVDDAFLNADTGKIELPAGLRVYEQASGKLRDVTGNAGGTLYGLLETNAIEDDDSAALTGYGVVRGGIVYLQLLPETLDGTAQDALALIGTGFAFETYADDRTDQGS